MLPLFRHRVVSNSYTKLKKVHPHQVPAQNCLHLPDGLPCTIVETKSLLPTTPRPPGPWSQTSMRSTK
ncbi:hypothetical protein CapIbe_006859 [Capra ibex]